VIKAVYVMSGRDIYRRFAIRARDELGVRPALWLGDQSLIEFARAEFGAECFSAGYNELLEGSFFEAAYSSETMVSYEGLVSSPDFRIWEPLLLQELNREPDIRFVRPVDREVFIRRVLLLLLSKYLLQKPELFFSSETPHNVIDLSAFLVAKWLSVPTLFFQPTSTIGPNLVPRSELDAIIALPETLTTPGNTAARRISDFRVQLAVESLTNFRLGAIPVRMQAELDREAVTRGEASKRRLVVRGRNNSAVFFYRRLRGVISMLPNFRGGQRWEQLLGQQVYSSWHKSFLDTALSLPDALVPKQPYALFPLHYQPERTSIPEGSTFAFQGDVVAQARALLPAEITLIVKEHASQISKSRSGYLGRAADFYDLVRSLPNTLVVGPGWPIGDYLEDATTVFTMTGSVGIEAVFRRVRVVYFGNPWWTGMPGTTKFAEGRINDELFSGQTALSERELRAARDFLIELVSNRTIPGFGTPSQERFWTRQLRLPNGYTQVELDSALAILEDFIRQSRT
jgi:hypothetical protein